MSCLNNLLRKVLVVSASIHVSKFHCLVTGAASGLGLETSRLLLSQPGTKAALIDMNDEMPASLLEFKERILWLPADITNEDSVERVFLKALLHYMSTLGSGNSLKNSVKIRPFKRFGDKSFEKHSLQKFQKVMNVNVLGTFNIIRFGCPLMVHADPLDDDGNRGVIVNVSSIAATDGQRFQCGYAASKGAINAMSLPLARELGPYGIRVCGVSPGMVQTPLMTSEVSSDQKKFLDAKVAFPKRSAKASEFAQLVKCIIENKYLNGTNIRLDAGLRL
ncbi:hypothetical protein ACOME3_004636 [Neoechinorhynchus agilis]